MDRLLTVLRTTWYRLWYQWILGKCEFGSGVQIRCALRIGGPGRVCLGANSSMEPDPFGQNAVVMMTHAPDARVIVGPSAVLRGASIGCVQRIEIGAGTLIEDAHIIDGDFHPIHVAERRVGSPGSCEAVAIGAASYVGSKAIIMKGAILGMGTMVEHGSVLGRQKFPSGSRVRGYPPRLVSVETRP